MPERKIGKCYSLRDQIILYIDLKMHIWHYLVQPEFIFTGNYKLLMVNHAAPENMYFALNSRSREAVPREPAQPGEAAEFGSPAAFKLSPTAARYPHRTTGIITMTYLN